MSKQYLGAMNPASSVWVHETHISQMIPATQGNSHTWNQQSFRDEKKNEQDHGYDGYGQVRGCFEKPSKKPCPSTTMLLMGKSTISTGPFAIAMLNYQRVTQFKTMYTKPFFRPSGPSFAHREMTPQQGAFVNGTPGRNTCRNRVYFQSFLEVQFQIPSGNLTVCYGKSPCY